MKYLPLPFAFLLLLFVTSCGSGEGESTPAGPSLQDSLEYLDDVLIPTLKPFGIGFSLVSAVNNYEVSTSSDTTFEDAQQLLGLRQRIEAFDKSMIQAFAQLEPVEEIAPDIGLKAHSMEALQAFKNYSDKVCAPFVASCEGGLSLAERAAIAEARRGLDVRTPLEMFQFAQEEFAKSLNMPQDSIGTLMSKYQIKPL